MERPFDLKFRPTWLALRREFLEEAKPHKGETTTTATLAPELRPLFTGSVKQMLGLQGAAPVTDYLGRNVQRTVPLSQSEREGIGLARGLSTPSGLSALALQQILRMPQLAGAGPGTGRARTNAPDIRTLLSVLQNPAPALAAGPGNIGAAPFGPEPRPPGLPVYGGGPGSVGPIDRDGGDGGPGPIAPLGAPPASPPATGIPPRGTPPTIGPRTGLMTGRFLTPQQAATGAPPAATTGRFLTPQQAAAGRPATTNIPGWDEPGVTPVGPTGPGTPPREPPVTLPPRTGPPPVVPPRSGGETPPLPPLEGPNIFGLGDLQNFMAQGPAPDTNYAFFDQSPTIKAAMNAFSAQALPTIQNQMNLSGLGRSTAAGNAIAQAQGQMLTPLLQSELDRQERSAVRTSEATQRQIQDLLQLTGAEQGRQESAVEGLMRTGAVERGIGQSAEDAAYQDFLRRQALSETGTMLPFGQTMPSAFGSRQISSGGLFKIIFFILSILPFTLA